MKTYIVYVEIEADSLHEAKALVPKIPYTTRASEIAATPAWLRRYEISELSGLRVRLTNDS